VPGYQQLSTAIGKLPSAAMCLTLSAAMCMILSAASGTGMCSLLIHDDYKLHMQGRLLLCAAHTGLP
jgi:hypothetical protein